MRRDYRDVDRCGCNITGDNLVCSELTPCATLSFMIAMAPPEPEELIIHFSSGTYKFNVWNTYIEDTLTRNGLTLAGPPSGAPAILECADQARYLLNLVGNDIKIERLTFSRCWRGPPILVVGDRVTFTGCVFSYNYRPAPDISNMNFKTGFVYVTGSAAEFRHCLFANNNITAGRFAYGGALVLAGSHAVVDTCSFIANAVGVSTAIAPPLGFAATAVGWQAVGWASQGGAFSGNPVGTPVATIVLGVVRWTVPFTDPTYMAAFPGSVDFRAQFTAYVTPLRSFVLRLVLSAADGVRFYVDGSLLLDSWNDKLSMTEHPVNVSLSAGQTFHFFVDYCRTPAGGGRLYIDVRQ